MKDFVQILKYIKQFKGKAILNIIFNLLSSFFTLFSFTVAIPFLGILFNTHDLVTQRVPINVFDISTLENNVYYYLGFVIENFGKTYALLLLGLTVIIFTLLKTITWYLANHFMVPLRNGVVQNIRNQLFIKILSLPLSYFTEERKGNIMSRMTSDVQEIEW